MNRLSAVSPSKLFQKNSEFQRRIYVFFPEDTVHHVALSNLYWRWDAGAECPSLLTVFCNIEILMEFLGARHSSVSHNIRVFKYLTLEREMRRTRKQGQSALLVRYVCWGEGNFIYYLLYFFTCVARRVFINLTLHILRSKSTTVQNLWLKFGNDVEIYDSFRFSSHSSVTWFSYSIAEKLFFPSPWEIFSYI